MARRRMTEEMKATAKRSIVMTLEAGNTLKASYGYAGISDQTLYNWLKVDQEFEREVQRAINKAEVHHVANVLKAASEGTWQASAWWLERRIPEAYGRKDRTVIAGDKDTPVEIRTTNERPEYSPTETISILEILRESGAFGTETNDTASLEYSVHPAPTNGEASGIP